MENLSLNSKVHLFRLENEPEFLKPFSGPKSFLLVDHFQRAFFKRSGLLEEMVRYVASMSPKLRNRLAIKFGEREIYWREVMNLSTHPSFPPPKGRLKASHAKSLSL